VLLFITKISRMGKRDSVVDAEIDSQDFVTRGGSASKEEAVFGFERRDVVDDVSDTSRQMTQSSTWSLP
jgi:hypothetical protein